MHCKVGLAILVKVGPISPCLDVAPIGLDRRNAGLADSAQQRLAQIAVLDDRGGMVMQTAADFLRMLPAPEHARRALPHELGAGIRQSGGRAHLRLDGTDRQKGNERCGANAKIHDGL